MAIQKSLKRRRTMKRRNTMKSRRYSKKIKKRGALVLKLKK